VNNNVLFQDYLHLHVSDTSTPWHKLFGTMEQLKAKYAVIVEDYSVSETTLEQVFLSFAKKQIQSSLDTSARE
jgi:ATP-binding cassette subfamily A (ABC1) protein 3